MSMTLADAITAFSAAIAAISFVVGISTWRREFVGKRRIELAESVLALFYEAADAIQEIRSPFGSTDEGTTRKRSEREREEDSGALDQAYVVFERYQKREKLFAELRSMKYRVMATFGANAGEPFDELSKVLNEIFFSARMLGTFYWSGKERKPYSEEELQKHYEEMQKYEAVFWYKGEQDDQIGPRVRRAVEKIEAVAKEANSSQIGWFEKMRRRYQSPK